MPFRETQSPSRTISPALGLEVIVFDLDVGAAHDAALAPASGNQRSVRGHAALGGQNGLGLVHAVDVFRRGLLANENHFLAAGGPLDRSLRRKDHAAFGASGAGGKALGNRRRGSLRRGVQHGQQQLHKLVGAHSHHRGLRVDEAFTMHFGRHAHGGHTVALADAALEHVQDAFLDGELDVLHVLVMPFEALLEPVELLVERGHGLLERRQVLALVVLGVLIDRRGRADACHYVLTLRVDQVLPVKLVLSCAGIAREGYPGRRGFSHIAEDHGLDLNSGAPFIRDPLDATVLDRAFAIPALEHGSDPAPQLLLGIVRERFAENLFHDLLEFSHDDLKVFRGQFRVSLVSFFVLVLVQTLVEDLADSLAVPGLDAGSFLHHHVGVHHDQPAVGVIREPGAACFLDQAVDGRARSARRSALSPSCRAWNDGRPNAPTPAADSPDHRTSCP